MKQINWESLYEKEAPKLKGLCRRYVADHAIAEDMVQETFITAIEKINTYTGKGSIEGWIRKIAINKSLQFIKNHQNNELLSENMKDSPDQVYNQECTTNKIRNSIESASFTSHELLKVLDQLPIHHRTVFNLYVLDGLKHHEIAELLAISTGTSKSHLARARKKAQELLYHQAIRRESHQQRRRLPFVFIYFSSHPLDRIFKQGLKNYQLAPGKFIIPTLETSLIKAGITFGNAVLLSAVTGVLITSAAFIFQKNNTQKLDTNTHVMTISSDTIDRTSSIDLQHDSINEAKQEVQDTIKNTPVIIRKKIIVYDTIYLKKPTSK